MATRMRDHALLRLLQLSSPALPVGAFSYSEGLETLVEQRIVQAPEQVLHWLEQELQCGAVRVEGIALARSHAAFCNQDWGSLAEWNHWLSAMRETAELRQQSWQMGRSLARTLEHLHPELKESLAACGEPCNFAAVFGLTAAHWRIDSHSALLGYLQSWATNLVNAAVKLVPLGQTAGQRLLLDLYPTLAEAAAEILVLEDDDIATSGSGLSLASMQHETLYSRLFRS